MKISTEKDAIRAANANLIQRMRNDEPLYTVKSESLYFPPRPTIAKNQEAMKRLYSRGEHESDPEKASKKGLYLLRSDDQG